MSNVVMIKMFPLTGDFAENKDVAREIRVEQIMPALERGQVVILNFHNVTGTTQSFVHALISELIRQYSDDVFDRVLFKNCVPAVVQIVNIVADYMEEWQPNG